MPCKSPNSNHIPPTQHSLWSHSATASSDFCKFFYILLNDCHISPQGITAFYWMLNSLLISVGCVNTCTPFCPSLSSQRNIPNLILGALWNALVEIPPHSPVCKPASFNSKVVELLQRNIHTIDLFHRSKQQTT